MNVSDPTKANPMSDEEELEALADENAEEATETVAESDPLAVLQSELSEAADRALRTQAELENYRKRASRELADHQRYAAMPLLRDLLPVVDNIGRALEAAQQQEDAASLVEGFQLVADQLQTVLTQHQCQPIDALNQSFDPNLHEAVSQQPSADHEPGTIMFVAQTGYLLHGRVVRPTQVVVASVPPAADAE